jgi:hypothetical protein
VQSNRRRFIMTGTGLVAAMLAGLAGLTATGQAEGIKKESKPGKGQKGKSKQGRGKKGNGKSGPGPEAIPGVGKKN